MNPICNMLHITYPIIQGGMGNISNAPLAAAVSEAGGLGTIGCGTMDPNEVEQIILEAKQLTSKPIALNIAISVATNIEDLLNLVAKHQIPVVVLSAGNPAPYISQLKKHHITVLGVVASVKHAKKAEAAGIDMVVAEGFEAAGIHSNLELTTFTLIPQLAQHVSVPIIAAGGIGDGKGLAAALALGACGVQLGTRLIATKEAPFHDQYKEKLIQSEGTDTVVIGRSVGNARRILKTPYAKKLYDLENEGMTLEQYNALTTEEYHCKAAITGDLDHGFLNGGQVAGLIQTIPSVRALFKNMVEDAETQLQRTMGLLTRNI